MALALTLWGCVDDGRGHEETGGISTASSRAALSPSSLFSAASAEVDRIRALLSTPALKAAALPALPSSSNPVMAEAKRRLSDLVVEYSKYGAVSLLYSPRITIPVASVGSSTDLDTAAQAFLASYPGLLGLDPQSDLLVLERVSQDKKGGATVRFGQTHLGVPCRGVAVTVILDSSRRVRGLLAQSMALVQVQATPTLGSAAAQAAALGPGETAVGSPDLLFVDRPEWPGPRLAWRARAKEATGAERDVFLDAHSGAVLFKESLVDRAVDWSRELWDTINPLAPRQVRGEEPFYCDYCNPKTSPCTCTMTTDEQAIWDASEAVASYLDGRSFSSWDDSGSLMRTNFNNTVANGEWNRQTKQVSIKTTCATADELVAHEWGHAIANDINFDTSGDPACLSEGFADCFALMVNDNNWQWNESAPTGCGGTRHAHWALNGGYRNKAVEEPHYNGQILSHICYLVSRLTYGQDGPYSCTVASACPGYWQWPPFVDCIDGTCVSWSNIVPVPYHGRKKGYAPLFKTLTNQSGYEFLNSSSGFENLVGVLSLAGCTYDELELSVPPCSVMGVTNYLAALAAGIWFSPLFVHYQSGGQAVSINTDSRPAFIENAKTGTTDNWAAIFYREGRKTDNAKLKYLYAPGDITGLVQSPQLILDSGGNPVKSGSGLIAVRSPNSLGTPAPDLGLFFNDESTTNLKYITGTLGSSSITWGSTQTVAQVTTDRTPAVVNFNSGLWYVWKDATSTTIKAMAHANPPGGAINAGGSQIYTLSAPTAVVAKGRLWVFYRKQGIDKIYFTSTATGGDWLAPEELEETKTLWDPEANFYQPAGGAFGDGRIWVFYKRDYDASAQEPPAGTRMVSMKPSTDGTISVISPPVFLYQTRLPGGTYEPFHSAFKWGVILRLYHPHEDEQFYIDGVHPLWKIEKMGEG